MQLKTFLTYCIRVNWANTPSIYGIASSSDLFISRLYFSQISQYKISRYIIFPFISSHYLAILRLFLLFSKQIFSYFYS